MSNEGLVEIRISQAKHISGIYRDSFNHRANHEWYIVVTIVGAILYANGKIDIQGWLSWLAIGLGSFAVVGYLLSLHSRNRMDKEKAIRAEKYILTPNDKHWESLTKLIDSDEEDGDEFKETKKGRKKKQQKGKFKQRFLYDSVKWIHIAILEILIMLCAVLIIA